MAIEWDPGLEIGIEEIDRQHRELFRRLDRLLEAVRARNARAEIPRLLEFLADYVVTHFTAEEHLMRSKGYPDLPAHKAEHDGFLTELEALKKQYALEGASTVLVIKVSNRVTSWLREHIYSADRQLGIFVNRPTW
jgi:hemerythrin